MITLALRLPTAVALSLAILACADPTDTAADHAIDPGDWPHYARDLAASKYSPLDQIDAGNVEGLQVAWSWESAD